MVSLREAIERADLGAVADALAEDVVWIGVLPRQLCRNRDQVLAILERARERVFAPEVILEREGMLVVDPHLELPADGAPRFPTLHQVYVTEAGRIVEMRDYPDREAALAAVETPL